MSEPRQKRKKARQNLGSRHWSTSYRTMTRAWRNGQRLRPHRASRGRYKKKKKKTKRSRRKVWPNVESVRSCFSLNVVVVVQAESRDKLRLYNRKLRGTPGMIEVPKPREYITGVLPFWAGVTILLQGLSSKASHSIGNHTGQSAAKPLRPLWECGRFRDYNRLGASLRYSPLPLATGSTEVSGCSSPREACWVPKKHGVK